MPVGFPERPTPEGSGPTPLPEGRRALLFAPWREPRQNGRAHEGYAVTAPQRPKGLIQKFSDAAFRAVGRWVNPWFDPAWAFSPQQAAADPMRPHVAQNVSPKEAKLRLLKEKIFTTFQGGQLRFLPMDDGITDETPEMREEYVKMVIKEPSVKSALMTKVIATVSSKMTIVPVDEDDEKDKRVAAFIEDCLTTCKGGTRKLGENILLWGLAQGHSLNEKVYEVRRKKKFRDMFPDGYVTLKQLKLKNPIDYRLEGDQFRNVRRVWSNRMSCGYDPSYFVIWQYMPVYENPAGTSDLRAAVRAYNLIVLAQQLRAIWVEQFSMPVMEGTYKDGDLDAKDFLEAAIQQVRSLGWYVVPNGTTLRAVEMTTRGESEFQDMLDDLRKEIYMSICGSYLQAMEGSVSNAAGNSETHRSVLDLFVWYLCELFAEALNDQIIPDLVGLNFNDTEFPRVSFAGTTDDDLQSALTTYQGLTTMGLPISKRSIYKKFNITPPENPEDVLTAPQGQSTSPGGLPGTDFDYTPGLGGGVEESPLDKLKKSNSAKPPQPPSTGGKEPATPPAKHSEEGEGDDEDDQGGASKFTEGDESGPKAVVNLNDAPAGPDGRDIYRLLNASVHKAAQFIAKVAAPAVERMTKTGTVGYLFTRKDLEDFSKELQDCVGIADLLGRATVHLRLAKAQQHDVTGVQFSEMPCGLAETFAEARVRPMKPASALDYFKSLLPSMNLDVQRWGDSLRRRTFTVAEAANKVILKKIQSVITERLRTGDTSSGPHAIDDILRRSGCHPQNPQYAEMVFRTNLMDAHNVAAEEERMEMPDQFPAWRYDGIDDGRQGKDHEVHFGRFYEHDVPFAQVRGPRVFNCRCIPTPIYKGEWARLRARGDQARKFSETSEEMQPEYEPAGYRGKVWESHKNPAGDMPDTQGKMLAPTEPDGTPATTADGGHVIKLAEWEEGKHPRAKDGRFGDKAGDHEGGGDKGGNKKPTETPAPKVPTKSKPKPMSEKAKRAKAAHVMVDKNVQRYAEEHSEPRMAKLLGGASFPNSEPMDLALPKDAKHAKEWGRINDVYIEALKKWRDEGGKGKMPDTRDFPGEVGHLIETKTMVVGKDDKLTMNAYAMVLKHVEREKTGAVFHTIASDDREIFGKKNPDESKRVYYYRRGIAGSARVGGMYVVTSEAELKKLIYLPEDKLPPEAQVKEKSWLTTGKWVPLKGERGFRNTKTGKIVRPKK